MPSSFLEIGLEAGRRWEELNAGERPWIRIGTALCGEAAGAFEVATAVESELENQGVSATVSTPVMPTPIRYDSGCGAIASHSGGQRWSLLAPYLLLVGLILVRRFGRA